MAEDADDKTRTVEFIAEGSSGDVPDEPVFKTFGPDASVDAKLCPDGVERSVVTLEDGARKRTYSGSFTIGARQSAELLGWLSNSEVCSRCGRSFPDAGSLSEHVESSHDLRL